MKKITIKKVENQKRKPIRFVIVIRINGEKLYLQKLKEDEIILTDSIEKAHKYKDKDWLQENYLYKLPWEASQISLMRVLNYGWKVYFKARAGA